MHSFFFIFIWSSLHHEKLTSFIHVIHLSNKAVSHLDFVGIKPHKTKWLWVWHDEYRMTIVTIHRRLPRQELLIESLPVKTSWHVDRVKLSILITAWRHLTRHLSLLAPSETPFDSPPVSFGAGRNAIWLATSLLAPGETPFDSPPASSRWFRSSFPSLLWRWAIWFSDFSWS